MKLNELNGGCSALSWATEDGLHMWGRNFDFNRIAGDTKITYIPSGTKIYTRGSLLENNLNENESVKTRYSCIGTGSLVLKSTPTLFEGMNENGLMGGQLYYRGHAGYSKSWDTDKTPLQPAFAVMYFLGCCGSVDELIDRLNHDVVLIDEGLLGAVPSVHWLFSDKTGDSVVIESDPNGLHIYDKSIGVLTNSPSYSWHRENLLNYPSIRTLDYPSLKLNGDEIEQCFSGTGSIGLPGDYTSPSRFVRLAYLKAHGLKGKDENSGVARMFRLLQGVAFPLGAVEIGNEEHITEYDTGVCDYDYTIYSSVMCAESKKFYWTTYDNPQIRCVDMSKLGESIETFDLLTDDCGIKCCN